jgi:hypothetical protein
VLTLAAFLPWVVFRATLVGPESVSGYAHDAVGFYTTAVGLVTSIVCLIRLSGQGAKWGPVVPILGGVSAAVVIYQWITLSHAFAYVQRDTNWVGGSVGLGLLVALVSSLGIVVAGVAAVVVDRDVVAHSS